MEGSPGNSKQNPLEVKRAEYLDLINDFSLLITLNTVHFESQFQAGHESEAKEFLDVFKAKNINGSSFGDFIYNLSQPQLISSQVSSVVLAQIYHHLKFIEARSSHLRPDSNWLKRFHQVKDKYTKVVTLTV